MQHKNESYSDLYSFAQGVIANHNDGFRVVNIFTNFYAGNHLVDYELVDNTEKDVKNQEVTDEIASKEVKTRKK